MPHPSSPLTVLAIAGSLRTASYNGLLVEAARALAPPDMAIDVYRCLRDVPHYDADLDTTTPPAPVTQLRTRIAAADGLLIATPEYNHSVPGVLKNALDWASTPPAASVLAGKPTAVMGASPSPFGAIRAQTNLRQILTGSGSAVLAKPEVAVFAAHERFDAEGRLVDDASADFLRDLLQALATDIRTSAALTAAA